MNSKPRIALTFRKGGENGGPYNSHKRIMESSLSDKYEFVQLFVPRARVLVTPWGMKAFVKEIKLMKPQLVQVTGLQLEGFLTMVACKLAKVKTFLAIHGSSTEALDISLFGKCKAYLIEKWTIRNADGIYGVSDYVSGWEICKKAKQHFGTIYNIPFDAKNVKDGHIPDLRSSLNIKPDDIVVVSTGRIVRDKGYDIFWETIQEMGHSDNVKYVVAGDGSYKEEWQREISEKGFENEVFLLGYRSDIANILSCADIFMMCTKHETLCISLLEAANAALPIVSTNIGGIPEIVEDGCGLLVDNKDVSGFCIALRTLINDSALRKELGANAQKIASTKFTTDKIISRLDEVYFSLLR